MAAPRGGHRWRSAPLSRWGDSGTFASFPIEEARKAVRLVDPHDGWAGSKAVFCLPRVRLSQATTTELKAFGSHLSQAVRSP